MAIISDRAKGICMLTSNAVLLLVGVSIVCHGCIRHVATRKRLAHTEVAATLFTISGVISLCLGGLDIAVAVCGLVCAHFRGHRAPLIANVSLLIASSTGNLAFIVAYTLNINQFISNEQIETRVAMVRSYGDDTSQRSRQFTAAIDLIQQTYRCCDWGGDVEGNIYYKTPWYLQADRSDPKLMRVFPNSCCIPQKPACTETQNLNRARKLGLVFEQDCMDVIVSKFKVSVWIVMAEVAIGVLVQISCAISPALYLIENAQDK